MPAPATSAAGWRPSRRCAPCSTGWTRPSLAFGPDTGHLFWAGIDPAAIIADYADRVRAVHLKDVHRTPPNGPGRRGASYSTAVYAEHVWTEPGQGDVQLRRGARRPAADFDGWFVVEVDNPDRIAKEESAAVSARWVAPAPGRSQR